MFAVVDTGVRFRVAGHIPEFWNALDGGIEPQMLYTSEDGRTGSPLHPEPCGSTFVIFARPGGLHVT